MLIWEEKIIFCQKCGAEMPDGSKVCPKCGAQQGVQSATTATIEKPKKKKTGTWIALGIVAIIIIAAIVGGGKDDNSTTSSGPNGAKAATSNQAAAASEDTIYAVGQTAKIDNCEMTVTDVKKSAGEEYDKPQGAGNEFVIVSVSIKNDGKENLSYSPFYFKMQNSQGQITDSTFTTVAQSTALNSGDLAPNGSVSGTVVFEEPKDDAGLILQYQDNVFADGTKLRFKCS